MCGMCANFTDLGVFCDKCDSIKENERYVQGKQAKLVKPAAPAIPMQKDDDGVKQSNKPKKSNPSTVPMIVIGCCLAIIAVQQFFAYQARYKPIAHEELVQNLGISSLERCILVFREIGTQLRSAQLPNEAMRCDDSGTPNIIERSEGNIKISHPHPDFYGYSQIYVSRSNSEPTLIR
ncbi:MAG: hypothetical protein ACI95C_002492 [Pseudohongiellaceae bacterium]|jgi:hypothetical protein